MRTSGHSLFFIVYLLITSQLITQYDIVTTLGYLRTVSEYKPPSSHGKEKKPRASAGKHRQNIFLSGPGVGYSGAFCNPPPCPIPTLPADSVGIYCSPPPPYQPHHNRTSPLAACGPATLSTTVWNEMNVLNLLFIFKENTTHSSRLIHHKPIAHNSTYPFELRFRLLMRFLLLSPLCGVPSPSAARQLRPIL